MTSTSCTIEGPSGSLAALLDLPNGESFPLVVLLHGFTGWKEEEHLSSLAAALSDAGIGALRFDAPGSGESAGTFEGEYRLSNYLASVEVVLEYAQRKYQLTPATTGVWGHSMGGFAAIASACRGAKVAAVCGSQPSVGRRGFSDDEVAEWSKTGWASFPNERFPTLDLPYDFYIDRQQYDVFEMITNLRAPLLLIAGALDQSASPQQVRSIYEAAPDPKTYREFPVGHFYKFQNEQLAKINAATVDFFASQLRPAT